MRNDSDGLVEKIKTHFMFNILFWKSCRLWHNSEKCITATRTTDDNL